LGGEHLSSSGKTPENLEGLTEEVGTLGLQVSKRNRCGAAKKWARKAKLVEAPTGDSGSGQPRTASGGQPRTQQGPGTLGAQQGRGLALAWRVPPERGRHLPGQSKQQQSAGGTPEGRQAKRPKQLGQLGYARVAREGLRVAVVGEDYPKSQISWENFLDIQRAIGRLVDELPEEGLTPRLADSYWSKGAAIMICKDEPTKDWLAAKVPTLVAWEGSRLKVVGMDALPTYKRVVAWFPGSVEDTERYFTQLRRLNWTPGTGGCMSGRRRPMESAWCSAST
jgi:hypothetical protein